MSKTAPTPTFHTKLLALLGEYDTEIEHQMSDVPTSFATVHDPVEGKTWYLSWQSALNE